MSSLSKYQSLQQFNKDCVFEIVCYLCVDDISQLSVTSKYFFEYAKNENIWLELIQNDISVLRSIHIDSIQRLNLLRNIIGFPSFKEFYLCLRYLDINILGLLKVDHNSLYLSDSLNGGLYCGIIRDDKLSYQIVDTNGDRLDDDGPNFIVKYDIESKTLLATDYNDGTLWNIYFTDRIIINFGNQGHGYDFSSVDPEPISLSSLPKKLSKHYVTISPDLIYKLSSCLGLFVAPYGSHGMEIINISLCSKLDANRVIDTSMKTFGDVQLHGFKIIGDPNVPANELSFCIDINNELNPYHVLQSDTRPIVMFPTPNSSTIVSFQDRLNNISGWYRGYGQINRYPPKWDPEWVGCSLITYINVMENNVRFTILWDDLSEHFRHAMDFSHLPLEDINNDIKNSFEIFSNK